MLAIYSCNLNATAAKSDAKCSILSLPAFFKNDDESVVKRLLVRISQNIFFIQNRRKKCLHDKLFMLAPQTSINQRKTEEVAEK